VSDVSPLASCQSLHNLELYATEVSDVRAFASSQSLRSLDLQGTRVSDVSALALCQNLRDLQRVREWVGDQLVCLDAAIQLLLLLLTYM
jgi:Leucine-rich repeat (LRR) protein